MTPDPVFDDPRLAALYDPLDPDRSDLDAYVAMAREFGARSVVDVGCGTGTLAVLLAGRGSRSSASTRRPRHSRSPGPKPAPRTSGGSTGSPRTCLTTPRPTSSS